MTVPWWVGMLLFVAGASFLMGRTIHSGTLRDAPPGCPSCGGRTYRIGERVHPYKDPGYPHLVITHCSTCQIGGTDEDAAMNFSEDWGMVTEGMPLIDSPPSSSNNGYVWVADFATYRRKAYPSRINRARRTRG